MSYACALRAERDSSAGQPRTALVQRGHDVVALDTLSPQVHVDPETSKAQFRDR